MPAPKKPLGLPPGPSSKEARRFFRRGSLEGTPEFLAWAAGRYGGVSQFKLFVRRFWSVSDPDAVRDVLVTKARSFVKSRGNQRLRVLLGDGLLTSEEPLHLRQRRLMQPAFHRERIAQYAAAMVDETRREIAAWNDGEPFDVAASMMRMTLAIAARTLFGANVSDVSDEVRAALATAMEMFPRMLAPGSELLDRMPLPSVRRFWTARARLDAIIYRMIAQRRANGTDERDLLSMLLTARDGQDGATMTDRQVRDEALTIFLAGHETTAVALMWTLYLLSLHPEVRDRLQAEVDTVLGGRAATFEDYAGLSYARNVLTEAMRLYPPAWIIGRRAVEDVEIGGYRMRRNDIALISSWVTHRDPRFYGDPEAFVPGRWEATPVESLPRFAYYPFGGGNRVCIGEPFAWLEGVLALATIAQRWRLTLVPGTPVATMPSVTLRAKYPMPMTPHSRSAAVAADTNGQVLVL
jgi:cytochrome P450